MLRFLPRWARLPVIAVAHPALGTALLVMVVAELALGGNGYLIKLGPLRLREFLFVACMIWTAAVMLSRPEVRPSAQIWGLFAFFLAATAFGVLLGVLNDNFSAGLTLNNGADMIVDPSPRAAVIAELKPLAYFPMLLFFVTVIRSRDQITAVVTALMLSGTFLATIYLLTLASAYFGLVSYQAIWEHLATSDEFIFRRAYAGAAYVGFLYKGMYYACVAALLLMLDPLKVTKAVAAVVILAVCLTMTRSLTVGLGGCIVVGVVLGPWPRRAQLACQLLLLVVVTFVALRIEGNLPKSALSPVIEHEVSGPVVAAPASPASPASPARGFEIGRETDNGRLSDAAFVWEHITPLTLAIGHGFGATIGKRTKIELTYVEILFKQGILGLAFWFSLFAYSWWLFRRVPAGNRRLGEALFLCSMFFFISTAANNVLTGSIGLGTVFIVLACLSALAGETRPIAWYSDFVRRTPQKFQAG